MATHGDSSRLHILGDGPFIPDEPSAVVEDHIRDGAVTADKLGGDVSIAGTVDDVTLEINGDGDFAIKDGGVFVAALDPAIVDDSTLEITTDVHVKDAGITGQQLATGILHVTLIDGVDGTTPPANAYALTGIAVGDEIVFVGHLSTKASIATLDDVTSSFTVTDTDEITDGDDTDFSSDQLQVIWIDHTP